jgi:hypothetical protein
MRFSARHKHRPLPADLARAVAPLSRALQANEAALKTIVALMAQIEGLPLSSASRAQLGATYKRLEVDMESAVAAHGIAVDAYSAAALGNGGN